MRPPVHGYPAQAQALPLTGGFLATFLTWRFLRFLCVGGSGVVVNLAVLSVAITAGLHASVGSVLAIEISILTNFVLHQSWTFSDRRAARGWPRACAAYHLVSLVGASLQFGTFVAITTIAPSLPYLPYVAQLSGIAVATVANYVMNCRFTWGEKR